MRLKAKLEDEDDMTTLSKLYVDSNFQCWTLEDGYREEKEFGKTRIPAGIYDIKFRTAGTWHEKNKKMGLVCGALHLQDVPNFTTILIHPGNYHENTEGCILPGKGHGHDDEGHLAVWSSKTAYKELYAKVETELLCGNDVTIEIIR